jgi:hypothetical protein
MDCGGREQAEAPVAVMVVVPVEEAATAFEVGVEAGEAIGEVGLFLKVLNWLSE